MESIKHKMETLVKEKDEAVLRADEAEKGKFLISFFKEKLSQRAESRLWN